MLASPGCFSGLVIKDEEAHVHLGLKLCCSQLAPNYLCSTCTIPVVNPRWGMRLLGRKNTGPIDDFGLVENIWN